MAGPYNTGLLDDFNRGDGDPGTNWLSPVYSTFAELVIATNTLAHNGWSANYWLSLLQEDQEVFCKIAAVPSTNIAALIARLQNPGNDSTINHYSLEMDGGNSYIAKVVAGARTQLGGNLGVTFAANDLGALTTKGTTIAAWRNTGGGWTNIGEVTDSAIPGTGYIGVVNSNDATFAIDDFGGGSISDPTATSFPRRGMALAS
jgi:hypothetical protein